MLAREVAEVGGVGAGEAVDRLGRVTDDADLVATAQPEVEQGGLERGDVLVLVDGEELVLTSDLGGDPLVLGQQRGGEEQHVLHVHPALAALDVLVGGEHPRHGGGVHAGDVAAAPRRQRGVLLGADVADLGPLDLGGEVAELALVGAEALAAYGEREQRQLGLGQRRQVGAVHLRPEEPQLAQRGGVEGARLDPRGTELAQPGAHLAGGPGGERHREHLGGLVDAGGHAVGDPVGDRAGLAGAGTGEHPDRPAQRLGDLTLLGVERVEEIGGTHRNNHLVDTVVESKTGQINPRCPR